jgi:FtsP/CotA-like multicopper oxidase with cupredoxin domain
MSRNQRLTFLGIAAVIAVVAVVILASSGGDESSPTAAQPTPSGTATPGGSGTATSTATPTPVPVLAAGQMKKLRYSQGDTVRFRVRSDAPEEVHVHGYDLKTDVEPGKPAEMSFKASITGIFAIELEHSGQQLAELRVDPK